MNKTLVAILTATALFCSPIAFADDDNGDNGDNSTVSSGTSSGTSSTTSPSTDTTIGPGSTSTSTSTTTTPATTGNTMTSSSTTTPGTTIQDLATSTEDHVDIQLKTTDGKLITATVHPGDLIGLKSGDQVTLGVPVTTSAVTTTP